MNLIDIRFVKRKGWLDITGARPSGQAGIMSLKVRMGRLGVQSGGVGCAMDL